MSHGVASALWSMEAFSNKCHFSNHKRTSVFNKIYSRIVSREVQQLRTIKIYQFRKTVADSLSANWCYFPVMLNCISIPCFTATDVDNLVKLMRTVNFKFLLDLNLQLRYGTQWDPTNTANLLGYINRMKYHDVFNFELGNGRIFSSDNTANLVLTDFDIVV